MHAVPENEGNQKKNKKTKKQKSFARNFSAKQQKKIESPGDCRNSKIMRTGLRRCKSREKNKTRKKTSARASERAREIERARAVARNQAGRRAGREGGKEAGWLRKRTSGVAAEAQVVNTVVVVKRYVAGGHKGGIPPSN